MSAVTKILCAVDLSEPSRLAMTEAAELARRFKAELTLLHVLPDPLSITGDVISAQSALAEPTLREVEKSLEVWRAAAAQLSEVPVKAEVLRDRNPAEEIVRFARQGHYDLIVVATHGRTGVKRLFLGSVAERVVREAHCKVLVVRRS
ncbi:MAG TPA: universal stress protein [Myxococcales bacterium]|jgi:nucleotide-binding universal stress UspA family protein